MKNLVNILVFVVLGLGLISIIKGVDWSIENNIYKIFCVLIIIAAILKGIITVSGDSDSGNQ